MNNTSTIPIRPTDLIPSPRKPPKTIRYSQIVKHSVEWLWPQRIALGKLTFVVGEPGLGKGLLAIDLAARISRGSSWPDDATSHAPAGTAILLHGEDDQEDTVPDRLEAAGADLDKIVTFQMEAESEDSRIARRFSLQDDIGALEAALIATPDCRLVVIDPLTAYLGSADGNHNNEVRSLLYPLAELAWLHRVAIVAVAHLNKRPDQRVVNRVLGALSQVAAARTVWGVVRDPKDSDRRLMLMLKSNVAEDRQGLGFRLLCSPDVQAPRLEWESEPSTMSLETALKPHSTRFNLAERVYFDNENHIATRLQEALSSGPQEPMYLDLVVGGSEGQRYRAADRLGVLRLKESYHWIWMLPEHYPEWKEKNDKKCQQNEIERRERKKEHAKKVRAKKQQSKEPNVPSSPSEPETLYQSPSNTCVQYVAKPEQSSPSQGTSVDAEPAVKIE